VQGIDFKGEEAALSLAVFEEWPVAWTIDVKTDWVIILAYELGS
jgi:hypothetical protein